MTLGGVTITMRQTVLELTWLDDLAELRGILTPAQLAEITAGFVSRPDLWRPLVHHDPASRWFERLLLTSVIEVWLIGWSPGQGTTVHDHGGSSGGMTVAAGSLVEEIFDHVPSPLPPNEIRTPPPRFRGDPGFEGEVARQGQRGGSVVANGQVIHEVGVSVGFRERHVHRVRNAGSVNATSIHAYSPPGQAMREYPEPVAQP
jgi:predicted metal-dependent enzyme (double-stranded beta helix superfamily)